MFLSALQCASTCRLVDAAKQQSLWVPSQVRHFVGIVNTTTRRHMPPGPPSSCKHFSQHLSNQHNCDYRCRLSAVRAGHHHPNNQGGGCIVRRPALHGPVLRHTARPLHGNHTAAVRRLSAPRQLPGAARERSRQHDTGNPAARRIPALPQESLHVDLHRCLSAAPATAAVAKYDCGRVHEQCRHDSSGRGLKFHSHVVGRHHNNLPWHASIRRLFQQRAALPAGRQGLHQNQQQEPAMVRYHIGSRLTAAGRSGGM